MGDEVRGVREERVERLVAGILGVMRGHYEEGPIERWRVFEVLEALAWVWVITLGPLGEEAREYFLEALGRRLPERGREEAKEIRSLAEEKRLAEYRVKRMRRYVEELEKQLEASVVMEIRDELERGAQSV